MVDIEYLLDLARMGIDSSEKSAFSEDLSKMIEYMNSIQNVSEDTLETEIVAPRLRDDEPCNGTVDPLRYCVPRTIDRGKSE